MHYILIQFPSICEIKNDTAIQTQYPQGLHNRQNSALSDSIAVMAKRDIIDSIAIMIKKNIIENVT